MHEIRSAEILSGSLYLPLSLGIPSCQSAEIKRRVTALDGDGGWGFCPKCSSWSVGRSVALLQIRERIMGHEGDRRGITQLDTGVPHSLGEGEGEPLADLTTGR